MARTYKTIGITVPPGVAQELAAMGQATGRTGARVAAEMVLREVEARSASRGQSPGGNRQRLTALVAAGAKLEVASRLVNEVTADVANSGLLPLEAAHKIALDLDAYLRRVTAVLELIPLDEVNG